MDRYRRVLDEKGFPIHNRGVSPIQGLYYIGLPWQHQRGSALICGVGRDAEFLYSVIKIILITLLNLNIYR